MTDFLEAWDVKERDFPRNGSASEKLAFCVRYAILAPSTYNTQPWFFRIDGDTLYLYADRRYALPVIDSDDRAMTVFCGAALYSLRLALNFFGYTAVTEILPDPSDEDLMAKVRLGERREPSVTDKELFHAITKRHMNRGSFSNKDVSEEALRQIISAASEQGGWLHVCDATDRRIILQMVAEGDLIQNSRKNFRRELAAWINPRRKMSGDGLPVYGQSFSDVMGTLNPQVVRRFEADSQKAANDVELSEGTPVLAIMGSKTGSTADALQAGQSLMRVLLKIQQLGLSVSTLNQPCEVPELRLRLHDEMEHQGRIQMILRIGYGGKAQAMPRRPVEAVLEFEGKVPESYKNSHQSPRRGFFAKLLAKRG